MIGWVFKAISRHSIVLAALKPFKTIKLNQTKSIGGNHTYAQSNANE